LKRGKEVELKLKANPEKGSIFIEGEDTTTKDVVRKLLKWALPSVKPDQFEFRIVAVRPSKETEGEKLDVILDPSKRFLNYQLKQEVRFFYLIINFF
jgi:hypothetical protein